MMKVVVKCRVSATPPTLVCYTERENMDPLFDIVSLSFFFVDVLFIYSRRTVSKGYVFSLNLTLLPQWFHHPNNIFVLFQPELRVSSISLRSNWINNSDMVCSCVFCQNKFECRVLALFSAHCVMTCVNCHLHLRTWWFLYFVILCVMVVVHS